MRAAIPTQGYLLTLLPSEASAEPHAHVFGGDHALDGARCRNCERPLLQMLNLDTADPRLGLASIGVASLPLLFCWTCKERATPFAYCLEGDTGVRVMTNGAGGRLADFPYPGYPRSFPAHDIALRPLSAPEQQLLRQYNGRHTDYVHDSRQLPELYPDLFEVQHQIGGEPYLSQVERVPSCPRCGRTTAFLASIADGNGTPHGLTGNCGAQLLFYVCTSCTLVAAIDQCD